MGRGVEEFHIYTLNRADLTAALCRLLRNDARAREIYIEAPLLLAGGLSLVVCWTSWPSRFCSATAPLAAAFSSEEHTYALQSLMRTSYAVFCLKKTKTP